jgi:hypothetical protein
MSKIQSGNQYNIESDWGAGNKKHRQSKIKAIGKKSRSTGRQRLKSKAMDFLEDSEYEESIYYR